MTYNKLTDQEKESGNIIGINSPKEVGKMIKKNSDELLRIFIIVMGMAVLIKLWRLDFWTLIVTLMCYIFWKFA